MSGKKPKKPTTANLMLKDSGELFMFRYYDVETDDEYILLQTSSEGLENVSVTHVKDGKASSEQGALLSLSDALKRVSQYGNADIHAVNGEKISRKDYFRNIVNLQLLDGSIKNEDIEKIKNDGGILKDIVESYTSDKRLSEKEYDVIIGLEKIVKDSSDKPLKMAQNLAIDGFSSEDKKIIKALSEIIVAKDADEIDKKKDGENLYNTAINIISDNIVTPDETKMLNLLSEKAIAILTNRKALNRLDR